ncbi:hypothetical protein RI030_16800 [Aphanizomenon flos-aquae NRERC-008]|jgi:hypothetical protein|uniref:Uncharacterized protein n=1 Tax=Aphanizomenon flos-aquae FACHB-1249 TaxID=2692889 RepID=A0ABR8INB3_APHFL|nr:MULTISPECIES: hypothetical protein [Aphanizomenon]MBD2389014.1 hypothetical protein [Aphanizomenon flos-aquae FACHB-1171]MBD2555458.1 hypothetical protein [Aphanizomenon flos-aquae FACHB-1290]MBD2630027.1 hypothetical protein [Aphanizomenon sp. FACHB-1399]MBD2641127.1 hypothetical protein [Aphanizomenon sp. FACHB-1401]MBD2655824.1 hypothetical protein [Aphanizomenon flos-aquae FACHB-1265]
MSGDKGRKSRNEAVTTVYQKNQPIWKTAIIQVLRGTIGVLETTVVKLETETPNDTQKKTNFLSRWDGFLRTFRLFLPSSISNNVSDMVLTVIFAVIFVVTIGTTGFLLIPKSSTQVAIVPPVEEVTATTPIVTPEPTPIPIVTPEPTLTPIVTPEPTPTPIVELTPEQVLLAAIENQFMAPGLLRKLSEISVLVKNTKDKNLISQLIKPLKANFRTSDLTIKVGDIWYKLAKSEQDKLAGEILKRSQELNFIHLEVVDFQEKLIARSPVVGKEMIIFKR